MPSSLSKEESFSKPTKFYCHGPFLCAMAKQLIPKKDNHVVLFYEGKVRDRLPEDIDSFDVILISSYSYSRKQSREIELFYYKHPQRVYFVPLNPGMNLIYSRPKTLAPTSAPFIANSSHPESDFNAFFLFPMAVMTVYESLAGFLTRFFEVQFDRVPRGFSNAQKVYALEEEMARVCNKKKVIFSFPEYGLVNFFNHLLMDTVVEQKKLKKNNPKGKRKIFVKMPSLWQKDSTLSYPKGAEIWDLSEIDLYPMITPGVFLEELFSEGISICEGKAKPE
jgi:hypothetical protein